MDDKEIHVSNIDKGQYYLKYKLNIYPWKAKVIHFV
jgi:hypothetical protein